MIELIFFLLISLRHEIFERWGGCVISLKLTHSLYRAPRDLRNVHLSTAVTFGNEKHGKIPFLKSVGKELRLLSLGKRRKYA